ncbi:hypothetical protein QCA50_014627 [Cerrena zonata]|uniref:Uncharacterized protein n=1 Tax=Cerrena zonata TaxID=2478898 RepID=A0AAW0FYP7_9APHY
MPTVSKRFSFKNLKRRLTGDNNDASERSRTPSPSRFGRNKSIPPDVEKGDVAVSETAKLIVTETSSASNETGIRLGVTQKEILTPLVPPHAAIDMPSPQLYVSPPTPLDPIANLAATGIMDRIHEGPTSSKTEKVLNKIDDMATTVQDPNGLVVTVVQPIKALLESSGAIKAIEEGINTFMEDIPWLMKGLDEIARIHPVVTVAVLAFKTVYKMEMTRRENDSVSKLSTSK